MSKRKNYTTECKHEAASLVLGQAYSTQRLAYLTGAGFTPAGIHDLA